MRKHLFLLPFLFLLFSTLCRAQKERKWAFQGITIFEKVGCVNDLPTKSGYVWIYKDESLKKHTGELQTQLKEQYGRPGITPVTVLSGKPFFIALVEKTVECMAWKGPRKTLSSLKFYYGPDKENITKQVDADRKLYPEIKSYRVVEWIDCKKETEKLDQQPNAVVVGAAIR